MRRTVALFSVLMLAGCGSPVAATSHAVTPKPTVEFMTVPAASAAAGNQDAVLGPAGMTLPQEIGAVMMVGFTGPLTPAVLEDWRRHQFGGLFVDSINHNGGGAIAIRPLIPSGGGVVLHQKMAGNNPEGGGRPSPPAATARGPEG